MSSSVTGSIADRLDQIRQTLPDSVRLIAVTKQVSVDVMRVAYEAGVRDFGESRLQEASPKQVQLQDLEDITWHFIGRLQSNKAFRVLEQFQWIHSVDSLKLAQRLDTQAAALNQYPQVCLQVKVVPDPGKQGWEIPALLTDLPLLDQCLHLKIAGLMTIPPYDLEPEQTRSIFLQTRELAEKIQQQAWQNIQLHQLSMGMSEDYPLAIQAGATMIRLGRILFGDRQ